MNVLVTNDDGYGEWGIEAVIESLSKKHNVYVIAPAGNQSGKSHSIHLSKPLEVKKITDGHWTTSGTPADCVITGIKSDIIKEKIDVVVSGINKGRNVGTDICYSGTCGAAKQAVIQGVPGIAVSLHLMGCGVNDWSDKSAWNFKPLADFVTNNLETLASLCVHTDEGKVCPTPAVFVNVNAISADSYSKAEFTDVSFCEYCNDTVEFRQTGFDVKSLFIPGKVETKSRSYSDWDAMLEGKIAVSRVVAEPVTRYDDVNLDSISFSL